MSSSESEIAEEVHEADSPRHPRGVREGRDRPARTDIFSWNAGVNDSEHAIGTGDSGSFMEETLADDELPSPGECAGGMSSATPRRSRQLSSNSRLGEDLRAAAEKTYGDDDFESYDDYNDDDFESESLSGSQAFGTTPRVSASQRSVQAVPSLQMTPRGGIEFPPSPSPRRDGGVDTISRTHRWLHTPRASYASRPTAPSAAPSETPSHPSYRLLVERARNATGKMQAPPGCPNPPAASAPSMEAFGMGPVQTLEASSTASRDSDGSVSEAAAAYAVTLFRHIDKNRDGAVNIREIIIALRKDPELAVALGLPSGVIRQEDGSRDALEVLFQRLDVDNDRQLSESEFLQVFSAAAKASGALGDETVIQEERPSTAVTLPGAADITRRRLKRRKSPAEACPERIAVLIARAKTLAARGGAIGKASARELRRRERWGTIEEDVGSGTSSTSGGSDCTAVAGSPAVVSSLVVARLEAENLAHRVRQSAVALEKDIAVARKEMGRRLSRDAAKAAYMSRALRRARASTALRGLNREDDQLALHDADLACVVADLARSLPREGDVDLRREISNPWESAASNQSRDDQGARRGHEVEDALAYACAFGDWELDGGSHILHAAGADLEEEWGGAMSVPAVTLPVTGGVPQLGKGRQALLRRLWASHRLRQEMERMLGEAPSDAPEAWTRLHLGAGAAASVLSPRASFDADADDFGAELDAVAIGAGRGPNNAPPAFNPPAHVTAVLRDSCALRRHAEAVLGGGGFKEDATSDAKDRAAVAGDGSALGTKPMSVVVTRRAEEDENAEDAVAVIRERINVGAIVRRGRNLRMEGQRLGL